MKKGQGQLVAFVLLIGFTVVLGLMVGNWMLKQSRKMSESTIERHEIDAMCADTAIVKICDNGVMKIKNKGLFTVSKFKVNGVDEPNSEILPNQAITLNRVGTIIPFVEIEGKDYGCASKDLTIKEPCPNIVS